MAIGSHLYRPPLRTMQTSKLDCGCSAPYVCNIAILVQPNHGIPSEEACSLVMGNAILMLSQFVPILYKRQSVCRHQLASIYSVVLLFLINSQYAY